MTVTELAWEYHVQVWETDQEFNHERWRDALTTRDRNEALDRLEREQRTNHTVRVTAQLVGEFPEEGDQRWEPGH